jgi:hypothetical protein
MVDVGERRLRQHAQRLALDDDELVLAGALQAHAVGAELAVGRAVGAQREKGRVLVRRGGDVGGGGHDDFGLLGLQPAF